MRRRGVLLIVALSFCCAVFAAQVERVYLQSGSHLRISIETYQTRAGLTPVLVSLAGAEVEAVMDAQGQVFAAEHGSPATGEPLFSVNLALETIDLAGSLQEIHVYERNAVRTRFWFKADEVELPLRLDEQKGEGTLYLGRLAIPAKVGDETAMLDGRLDLQNQNSQPLEISRMRQSAHLSAGRIKPSPKQR